MAASLFALTSSLCAMGEENREFTQVSKKLKQEASSDSPSQAATHRNNPNNNNNLSAGSNESKPSLVKGPAKSLKDLAAKPIIDDIESNKRLKLANVILKTPLLEEFHEVKQAAATLILDQFFSKSFVKKTELGTLFLPEYIFTADTDTPRPVKKSKLEVEGEEVSIDNPDQTEPLNKELLNDFEKNISPQKGYLEAFHDHFQDWSLEDLSAVWKFIQPYENIQTTFKQALKIRRFQIQGLNILDIHPFIQSIYLNLSKIPLKLLTVLQDVLKQKKDLDVKLKISDRHDLSVETFQILSKIPNITSLKLDYTNANDECAKIIASIESLQEINIQGSKITHIGAIDIAKLRNIRKVNFSGGDIFSTITNADEVALVLAEAPNLEKVNLGYSDLTDIGGLALAKCKNLRSIDFSCTKITDQTILKLALSPILKELGLCLVNISDIGGIALANSPSKLEVVDFHETYITDKTAIAFGQHQNLKEANVTSGQITKAGVIALAKPKLAYLNANSISLSNEDFIDISTKAIDLEEFVVTATGISDKDLLAFARHPSIKTINLDLAVTPEGNITLKGIRQFKKMAPHVDLGDEGVEADEIIDADDESEH